MNLSVVIPNYNGAQILGKNLPKILKELEDFGKEYEIIIVDDGSEDNSIEVIKKFPKIKLFLNPKNLGFSSTVDRGVEEASGQLILLLNTDVYPEKGFLGPLVDCFEDEKVFAVGCMDKSIEKEKIVLRGRGIGSWQRGFLVHSRGEVDRTDTLWVSGGSGMFRKSIWVKLGGLNRLFDPFYWEDIDLSYRALKSGFKVLFEPKSIVFHEHEKGVIKKKFSPFDVKVIAYRNQFTFVWTNLTDFDLLIKHILFLPYHMLKAIIGLDGAFYLGFFKALIILPKSLTVRYNNKKLFVKSDKEITQQFS
ncbi:MAG: glycosyltransferase family 2 protein [Candidatus Levybacteria bacterium]|nr:glycosyltransferase family 2 protein [Candidatus Levybacteria bacterium]